MGGEKEGKERDTNGKIMLGKKKVVPLKKICGNVRATHLPTDETTHVHGWTVV
jgi:hypothetical protein